MTSSCFFIDCCSLCILLAVRSVRTTNAILRQQFKDHLSTEDDHQEDHVTLGSPETSEFQSCYGPEGVEMFGVHIAIFSRFEYANYQEELFLTVFVLSLLLITLNFVYGVGLYRVCYHILYCSSAWKPS